MVKLVDESDSTTFVFVRDFRIGTIIQKAAVSCVPLLRSTERLMKPTIFIREISGSPPLNFGTFITNPPKKMTDPCLKQAIIFHCQCALLPGHEVNVTFQLLWLASCQTQLYTNPGNSCQHLKNMVSPFWIILKPDLKNEFQLIRTNKYGETGISG